MYISSSSLYAKNPVFEIVHEESVKVYHLHNMYNGNILLRRASVAHVNTRLQRYIGQLSNRTAALLIYLSLSSFEFDIV